MIENKALHVAAVAIVKDIKKNPKFLIAFRRLDKTATFPGGKTKEHETPKDCALRETEEETGLVLKSGLLLDAGIYRLYKPSIILTLFLYIAREQLNPQSLDHKLKPWKWVPPEKVIDLSLMGKFPYAVPSFEFWDTFHRIYTQESGKLPRQRWFHPRSVSSWMLLQGYPD